MPTYEDARAELSRELQARRADYPSLVISVKLNEAESAKRIRSMQAAYDLLVKCHYDHPVKA